MSTLASRLKQARKDASLTQEDLAREAEVRLRAVSHWEAARRLPTVVGLMQVARVLGVEMGWLVGFGEKGSQPVGAEEEEDNPFADLEDEEPVKAPVRNPRHTKGGKTPAVPKGRGMSHMSFSRGDDG